MKVKEKSIFKRYMTILVLASIVFSALIIFVSYKNMDGYFKEEIYKLMESSQINDENSEHSFMQSGYRGGRNIKSGIIGMEDSRRLYKTIVSVIGGKTEVVYSNMELDDESMQIFEKSIYENINADKYHRNQINIGENSLLYIINPTTIEAVDTYVITSIWGSYPRQITREVIKQIAILSVIFILFLWTMAYIFNKYMESKFKTLNKNLSSLESRNWEEFRKMDEVYETGRLNQKINQVRGQLKSYDNAQKEQFHTFSHELKTPIMIIKGYLDSIKDGLYPKGDLESSIEVVYEETDAMEQLIKNVLYLNKLEYLNQHYKPVGKISIEPIMLKTVERFKILGQKLNWIVDTENISAYGTEEQWQLIFDNLISNQIRYAKTKITLTLTDSNIIIGNDGEKIEKGLEQSLFEPFKKGNDGKSGLGLSIVDRLLKLNGYSIEVRQENDVEFLIKI